MIINQGQKGNIIVIYLDARMGMFMNNLKLAITYDKREKVRVKLSSWENLRQQWCIREAENYICKSTLLLNSTKPQVQTCYLFPYGPNSSIILGLENQFRKIYSCWALMWFHACIFLSHLPQHRSAQTFKLEHLLIHNSHARTIPNLPSLDKPSIDVTSTFLPILICCSIHTSIFT